MELADLVETSASVAASSARLEKIEALADCVRRLAPDEIEIGVAFLAGEIRQGRVGVGGAALRDAAATERTPGPSPSLAEVDAAIDAIAAVSGPGSAGERSRQLGALFARTGADERAFLSRLFVGELRQGALGGLVVEAVARASGVPAAVVRRARMFEGDLPRVARAALTEGEDALARFTLRLFRPVEPMLASPADDVAAAVEKLGVAGFEHKLDGARIQVHAEGESVRVYTRRLHDVTHAVPEVVEALGSCRADSLVLDGEVLALRADGRPHPFQTTMRRFGRKLDVEALRESLPLRPFFFDCLHRDGRSLIDAPASERIAALEAAVPEACRVPRTVTGDAAEAAAFLESALAAGHEGLVAKALDAPYAAGARGSQWLKLKPAHTLDLVVLAAEWGHGRRKGWLSNLHLGARDPEGGGFVMLGKTFKGLTDELLAWQTERLQALEVERDEYTVRVRPELVVEIAFNEIQASPRYPGGLALRFARVKGYRPDKSAAEADTLATVRALHEARVGGGEAA